MCMRYGTCIVIVSVIFLQIGGNNLRQDIAEETQHAICNISTKDVQTSANASVTRQLKGVCTSKQLDLRFKELESKILREFGNIKKLLLEAKGEELVDPSNQISTKTALEYPFNSSPEEEENSEDPLPIFSSFKTTKINHNEEPFFLYDPKQIMVSLDGENSEIRSDWSVQKDRIDKLNGTIQKGNKNVYYYFWKVENFNKLMTRSGIYVTSPSFMVLGHDLVIQIFPNQPDMNFLTIKMRTNNSFVKKHKFSILQRTPHGENIDSPLLGFNPRSNEVFPVPLKSIKNSECLKEDSIIIELKIFL